MKIKIFKMKKIKKKIKNNKLYDVDIDIDIIILVIINIIIFNF